MFSLGYDENRRNLKLTIVLVVKTFWFQKKNDSLIVRNSQLLKNYSEHLNYHYHAIYNFGN